LAARLLEIKLGVFGYSSTYDQLIDAANYREYLSMAASLGDVALVAAAMQCFAAVRSRLPDRLLVWLIVGYEVCFGFLSGFKSAVIMPFIIVAVVYYSQRKRFPRWLVPSLALGLVVAYGVIEPFRLARTH